MIAALQLSIEILCRAVVVDNSDDTYATIGRTAAAAVVCRLSP